MWPLEILPVTANADNVPTEVIVGCEAVAKVPTILVAVSLAAVILPVTETLANV